MPSGCLRLHGAEGDSAGFPHPGHGPEGDQGGKGLARCPGGQAGSRAAAGAPPLPHRPRSLPSSPRRPPECPQAAPASAGGVESLVPRPCSSGTSLSKVCVQRLPAPSGEQHLEGRLGCGGGPGPRFLEEQGALLERVPSSLHSRDRTEPPPPTTSLSQEAAAAAPCRPAARLGLERRPRPCSGAVPTLPGGEGGAGAGTPGPQR